MKKLLVAAAIAVCALGSSTALAQSAEDSQAQVRRAADAENRSDRPAGMLRVVIPAKQDMEIGATDPVPTPEMNPALPMLEDVPSETEAQPPSFFGEPVTGNFILVLDRSGSMGSQDLAGCPVFDENGNIIANPSRIQTVQTEATKLINSISSEHEFAIVTFGGNQAGGGRSAGGAGASQPVTRGCGPYTPRPRPRVVDGPQSGNGTVTAYGARVTGTQANKQRAASTIGAMRAVGPTPLYNALRTACTRFGTDIDKLFVLTDGNPNVTGNTSDILRDFPGWYSGMQTFGCETVALHIGNAQEGTEFLQSLAQLGGGKYIKV